MTAAPTPQHPIHIPAFRALLVVRVAAVVGLVGMVVILGYQLYDMARLAGMSEKAAAFQLGLLGLAQFIAFLAFAPYAGYLADRFNRVMLVRLALGADLVLALVAAYLTAMGAMTLPLVFAIAVGHASARALMAPAFSTLAPNIVPKDLLPQAIAISSMVWQIGAVIGPIIAGFLFAHHAAAPYAATAGLILIALFALAFLPPIIPPAQAVSRRPWRQIRDGLSFVRGHRFLMGAITLDLFAVLLGGATALLPVFARDILHVGPQGLGLMRGATGAGAVMVALWFSYRPLKTNVGVKMLWAGAAFGLATVGFGLSTHLWVAMLFLALVGAADMFSVYIRNSLVQLHTPDAVRGRVGSVSQISISASNELGELQSGLAASVLGPVVAAVAGGIGAIVIVAVWAYIFPELRRARTFDPPSHLE